MINDNVKMNGNRNNGMDRVYNDGSNMLVF
jgi:hypothetical protein